MDDAPKGVGGMVRFVISSAVYPDNPPPPIRCNHVYSSIALFGRARRYLIPTTITLSPSRWIYRNRPVGNHVHSYA